MQAGDGRAAAGGELAVRSIWSNASTISWWMSSPNSHTSSVISQGSPAKRLRKIHQQRPFVEVRVGNLQHGPQREGPAVAGEDVGVVGLVRRQGFAADVQDRLDQVAFGVSQLVAEPGETKRTDPRLVARPVGDVDAHDSRQCRIGEGLDRAVGGGRQLQPRTVDISALNSRAIAGECRPIAH